MEKWFLGYQRTVAINSRFILVYDITREYESCNLCRLAPYLKGSSVYADKGYCSHRVEEELRKYGCRSYIIKRNNMKSKDFSKVREISRNKVAI
ncbi:MAG: transposase [Deltaproteobacteria bacterium]|nr:transposase [Deltaproteobacteria bacterium]